MNNLRQPFIAVLLGVGIASSAASQMRVVNMIPNARSGETNQDAEPTLTLDRVNPLHMAGSAFTWDNLTGAPMVTASAPIYLSVDAGNTWSLSFIVPSQIGSASPTGDITMSFSSTSSGATAHSTSWLYGGILGATDTGFSMLVLRAQDPFDGATMMVTLDTRSGNVDQPHTTAMTASSQDRLFVGFNNGYNCVVPSGRTSSVDVSQSAAATTPTFALDVIEARNTSCQDGYTQVVAAHSDGTVYGAFLSTSTGFRIVVVRDDSWASGTNPFSALVDPSDLRAGRFVTATSIPPSGAMGQNRLTTNVSIAVDPTNSDRVYVAWGEANGSNSETIHVRRSITRGADWSPDLLTVAGAMNPEVAINDVGVVGVLYQQLNAGNWETRLARTNDLDATNFDTGILLAKQSASSPAKIYDPYLGDYASLTTSAGDFVGIFSASNYPDRSNFLPGVQYQREVDWKTHKLYADAAHTTEVAVSIDPFFFAVPTSVCQRSLVFCNVCARSPSLCYAIYDPLWFLKCPQCGVRLLVDPGDEFKRVDVVDSRGKPVGQLARLEKPVVERGIRYTYVMTLRPEKNVGYVLRAEPGRTTKRATQFRPRIVVRQQRQ